MRASKEGATEVAMLLRKRALEQHQEDVKRAKKIQEEERIEAKSAEELKQRKVQQEELVLEARRKCLAQALINRQDHAAKKQREFHAKVFQRWFQTTYPAILVDRCIEVFKNMSKDAKTHFAKTVQHMIISKAFTRPLWIPNLWSPDHTFTKEWDKVKDYSGGGGLRSIRCGTEFAAIIHREVGQSSTLARNAPDMFSTLCRKIFSGNWQPMKLLDMNDYVIE